ncbi:Putative electron transport protein YccM [Aquisphaera giovannonii]|uniref:Electron transport protein YccM n=1 Tax=Aquisphaera giovannonii TaxID=406548 RepID=A0A5B9W6N8_9BACT|nr:4Fe-4S dicluster domain-containing protein [Aquisphaera giovannonii]QEH35839.1 Putative electron transport protein YccM [Aquisphaera giovannonii]
MVKIRRAYEVLFLGLFLFFLFITDLRYLKGWPVSIFLEATPLVAVATALTTHTIYRNLVWGLAIIAVTMMLGRVWCNWMCPFGILHHLFGWIGNRRNTKQLIEVNRYKKIYAIKYYILAIMIAMASLWMIPTAIDAPSKIQAEFFRLGGSAGSLELFLLAGSILAWVVVFAVRGVLWESIGVKVFKRSRPALAWVGRALLVLVVLGAADVARRGDAGRLARAIPAGIAEAAEEKKAENSTLQIGLLDPIALTVRSMTTAVLPTVHKTTESVYTEPREYWQAWIVGLVFLGFLFANWWIPRFFCRAICPLGALLGIFSRFSLWRIDRDPVRCTDCDLCLKSCEGASDPHKDLRKSECFVCLNCIEECPHDALSYRFLPRKASEITYPEVGRRELLLAGLFGLVFYPMVRKSGGVKKNFSRYVIRPPGSVAEDEFLRRCIKCDQCIRVCPTNVLQPALFEAGAEGLWTPIMISKMGWCELNCTLCSQVCPTGAIREISIVEKLGIGPFEQKGPIKTGTAFYNQGRCLPWAMDTSCVVCEEVCPVSPKAIFTRNVEVTDRWGATLQLKRPYIDPVRCIGCGICEHECPVKDDPAVYVTAVGESRAKDRSLLLSLVDGEAQDWVSV